MIPVALKLSMKESAQVEEEFTVELKSALHVNKLQYIQTRSEYSQPSSLHLVSSFFTSLNVIAVFDCNLTNYIPGLFARSRA